MRSWAVLVGSVALLVHTAPGQTWKEWTFGRSGSRDPAVRDGSSNDLRITGYVQRLENAVASAIPTAPAQIRLTRNSDRYASRLPGGVLYLSAGLLERVETEAELAGLLAHVHAHAQEGCVLGSPQALEGTEAREGERRATAAAIGYLKAADYDPAGVLDILSKLSYEHPPWARTILAEDLLELRAATEPDALPPGAFRFDSSEFRQVHALVKEALARAANRDQLLNRPRLSRR
jgi:hypothetical protein